MIPCKFNLDELFPVYTENEIRYLKIWFTVIINVFRLPEYQGKSIRLRAPLGRNTEILLESRDHIDINIFKCSSEDNYGSPEY